MRASSSICVGSIRRSSDPGNRRRLSLKLTATQVATQDTRGIRESLVAGAFGRCRFIPEMREWERFAVQASDASSLAQVDVV